MLDDTDPTTFAALSELVDLKATATRPIVFWVGAGASRWADIPGWGELADKMRNEFRRYEPGFKCQEALQLCEDKKFPEFFELCRQASRPRYHNILVNELKPPKAPRPVYQRFISAIRSCSPAGILTTNVDELLEQSLMLPTLMSANLERIHDLITERSGFVAKLHGSISSVDSLVFTASDYAQVATEPSFSDVLKRVFQEAHVVFFGYGLADEHVLTQIRIAERLNAAFGSGPHFACVPDGLKSFFQSVKSIRYIPEPHKDHRCAIQVIEELSGSLASTDRVGEGAPKLTPKLVSAHYLADVYPPGNWLSSQRCELATDKGPTKIVMHTGHGLTNEELPNTLSTAMHDLVVGLLCFDQVFASFNTIARVVHLLGDKRVVELVSAGLLRFVRTSEEEVVMFPEGEFETNGELACARMDCGQDGMPLSHSAVIRRLLPAKKGKEVDAERALQVLCDTVERSIIEYNECSGLDVTRQVRGVLVRPSVRRMLGMSDATPAGAVPSWLKFPILRLAHVVRLGSLCRGLNLASAKLDYGNDLLAAMSFGSSFAPEYAHSVAGYVVGGTFGTDLGQYVNLHPEVLDQVIRFHDTQEGASLRAHIIDHLNVSGGGEVATAINAGLRQFIPTSVLHAARAGFSKLLVPSSHGLPAIWHDATLAEAALQRWRKKSAAELANHCKTLGKKAFESCPCGSGESIRNCCAAALGTTLR